MEKNDETVYEIKILGKTDIITNEEREFYLPRVHTNIPIYENSASELCRIFKALEFKIENLFEDRLYVLLPYQWIHIKIGEIENIIDELGRVRITIDNDKNDTVVNSRYGYGIEFIDCPEKDISAIKCYITDSGSYKNIIKLTGDQYQLIIDSSNGDKDKLLYYFEELCDTTLEKYYPNWKDKLKYWED